MSFGFSPSDIAKVIEVAVRIHRNYTSSPKKFGGLANDVEFFKGFLAQVKNAFEGVLLDPRQESELARLTRDSTNLLNDIEGFLNKYGSLRDETPRKRDKLMFPAEEAEKLKKRLYEHVTRWTAHHSMISIIVGTKNSEITSRLLRCLTQNQILIIDGGLEKTFKSPNIQNHIAWRDIERSLDVLKVSKPRIKEKVENAYRESLSQRQSPFIENAWTTVIEEDEIVDFHDDSIMNIEKCLSSPSSIESSQTLHQVPTDTSESDKQSIHGRYHFRLPPEPPYAFDHKRATKRSKSVSDAVKADVVKSLPETRRKWPLVSFHNISQLGSSAPSIAQQRAPFRAGFSRPADVSRSILAQVIPVSCNPEFEIETPQVTTQKISR